MASQGLEDCPLGSAWSQCKPLSPCGLRPAWLPVLSARRVHRRPFILSPRHAARGAAETVLGCVTDSGGPRAGFQAELGHSVTSYKSCHPLDDYFYLHGDQMVTGSPFSFIFFIYFSVTIDLQYYVCFRCTTKRLHIHIPYKVISPVSLVSICHHT